ncbi:hypothetical protein Pcinc_026415 [Petrolisthes cinctipes]|uniref:Uncharacterized protein n=1 Tax=Petrolisthes cinctipes TaxID=88211 RepID=A0AAE1F7E9_PETCI|nr:hypothetical protein Pcinc_026415 [Petrolisthes cinctipes]
MRPKPSFRQQVSQPHTLLSPDRPCHFHMLLCCLQEEDVAGTTAAAAGSQGTTAGLTSPSSAPGGRFWRRGPWYAQMGRVFATFLSRICPCRCPTKP